ncbi:MAG TPA: TetR/AcrR family transcriptional regulator [Acidimicrobiales bacterium]|jgi:AcrR family transcriptional regulator|nr:TetR/AcrR family transcriptional regulator [Acidimicrobiales bacterium]
MATAPDQANQQDQQPEQAEQAPETKGAQTRRAILQAAVARFGRDGYRATSVADIARDAGVGGTVAYAYFPNKEALFFAAVDEDAAGVIEEGVASTLGPAGTDMRRWQEVLLFTLVAAVERHPLAKRLLAGLEPEVTPRVLEMPALNELRKACTELLRTGQATGTVRTDIDPAVVANGIISLMLSILMSVTQLGSETAVAYAHDVTAVFEAALITPAQQAPPSP